MATVLTSKRDIEAFRLHAVMRAIRLEETTGLRHSKLGSVRVAWAKHLGLSPRTKADKVIEAVEGLLAELER